VDGVVRGELPVRRPGTTGRIARAASKGAPDGVGHRDVASHGTRGHARRGSRTRCGSDVGRGGGVTAARRKKSDASAHQRGGEQRTAIHFDSQRGNVTRNSVRPGRESTSI